MFNAAYLKLSVFDWDQILNLDFQFIKVMSFLNLYFKYSHKSLVESLSGIIMFFEVIVIYRNMDVCKATVVNIFFG